MIINIFIMIDFHNHILPGVDDGAIDLDTSLDMLREAHKQGITDVVNTVHYQHPKVDGEDISFDRIIKEKDKLQDMLKKYDIPINLHIGAEVFFLPNLCDIINDPLATFIHGKYMLIEFQVHSLPDTQSDILFDLFMKGVTPIIAHPERYKPVQDNLDIAFNWINAGCLLQLDAGSLTGSLGEQSKIASIEILKRGWCHIIGSDAHNNKVRNFCLDEGIEVADKLGVNNIKDMIFHNPQKIINGEKIDINIDITEKPKNTIWSRLFN